MNLTLLASVVLAALSAGGLAYVFIYPLLSGEKRAEKRQKSLVGDGGVRRGGGDAASRVNDRREQVAASLRDLEQREKSRNRLTVEARIAQAGLTWSKGRFIVVSAVSGIALAVVMFALTTNAFLAAVGLLIGGLGMPRWALGFMRKRRINRYLEELPNAIDVIVRGIRSGLPVADCLRIIANEAQDPVRSEFRYLVEQQTLGLTITEAVAKLYERVPVPESNFFAIVVGIQQKSGGNLSETLGNLSRVLRERRKMKAKIVAMSMEAKASASIIAALPFIVALLTYVTSPTYVELLWITFAGKMMLAISAIWMSIGVFVMKKMINFDF